MKCGEIAIWISCLENLLISAPLSTGLLPSLYCTKLADSRPTNSHITPHLIQNNNLYYTGTRSWACLKLTILRLFEHYVMLCVDSRWITRLTHSEQPIHLSTIHILLCFDFLLFCIKKRKINPESRKYPIEKKSQITPTLTDFAAKVFVLFLSLWPLWGRLLLQHYCWEIHKIRSNIFVFFSIYFKNLLREKHFQTSKML